MTSEFKHTPGPWHTGEGQANRIVYAPNGYAICDTKVFHCYSTTHEDKANARLIAAAPDLLEALEAIQAYADVALAKPELFGGIEAVRNLRGPAFDDARAAIAKATGAP